MGKKRAIDKLRLAHFSLNEYYFSLENISSSLHIYNRLSNNSLLPKYFSQRILL